MSVSIYLVFSRRNHGFLTYDCDDSKRFLEWSLERSVAYFFDRCHAAVFPAFESKDCLKARRPRKASALSAIAFMSGSGRV